MHEGDLQGAMEALEDRDHGDAQRSACHAAFWNWRVSTISWVLTSERGSSLEGVDIDKGGEQAAPRRNSSVSLNHRRTSWNQWVNFFGRYARRRG